MEYEMTESEEKWTPSDDELGDILRSHVRWLQSSGEKGERADLSGVNLSGELSGVNLSRADLSKADLSGVDLSKADLSRADLPKADLSGANLSEADLKYANLLESHLDRADLSGADLVRVNLSGADLTSANLSNTQLGIANLSEAVLKKSNLLEAVLKRADLSGAHLQNADLSEVDLEHADLSGADLQSADLSGASLNKVNLSGAVLNDETLRQSERLRGAREGVNGIFVKSTDSAALTMLTPPADSMQGRSAKAVLESLKHARRLHGISVGVALLGLGILFVQVYSETPVTTISLPFLPGLKFPVRRFALLGMTVSTGLLSLVKSFMADALSGARYLQTRNDAMKVGNFPWALSRYTGQQFSRLTQSLITRFMLAYHPLAYVLFWDFPVPWYYWVLGGTLLLFSTRIFVISQRFQRPIIFDPQTEEHRKNDLEKLAEAIKQQTTAMKEVANQLKAEQQDEHRR